MGDKNEQLQQVNNLTEANGINGLERVFGISRDSLKGLKKEVLAGLGSIEIKTKYKLLPEDIETLLTKVKPGDVVLVGNLDELSSIAIDTDGSKLTHAMLYLGGGELIHATKNGVVVEKMADLISHYETFALARSEDPLKSALAIDKAKQYLGKPYDFDFEDTSDDSLYCTELVAKSYGIENKTGQIMRPVSLLSEFQTVATSKNLQKE